MKQLGGSAATAVRASPEACFALVAAVDQYPRWYPELIRRAELLTPAAAGQAGRVRATVHVAVGPLVRDLELTMDLATAAGREVRLTRVPHEPGDPERFEVLWRVHEERFTRLELTLSAALEVPRLVPLGGLGDRLAQGFVEAARRELEGASPNASASNS